MIATADSKVRRRICVITKVIKTIPVAVAVWFPKRVISKCPATMLAIKRTARVRGRITFLMDSINTINGIKAPGVLCGTR